MGKECITNCRQILPVLPHQLSADEGYAFLH